MALIIVLLALGLVQVWGSGGPLQRDGWFFYWRDWVQGRASLNGRVGLEFGITILLPVLASALLLALAESVLGGLGVLMVSVPLLLYSLGRGNFNDTLAKYLRAWYQGDLEAACIHAQQMLPDMEALDVGSDAGLHRQVFRAVAYRAFERMFAVLFWFLLLGAPGAVLYRLSRLYLAGAEKGRETSVKVEGVDSAGGSVSSSTATPYRTLAGSLPLAARWLWLLEWLPVRVLGFSLAIVGNFAGCYRAWRRHLTCGESATGDVLEYYLEGALGGIDASECSAGATVSDSQRTCGAELEALQALLSRALLMWITALALYTIFGS
ncbi:MULTISPECIES: transcriptional regulator [Microbulbifer]|uniref:Transcriptional regulator n=1 Tax=Microbulbifer celer TaxID=435905 RepID=A0ABW3U6G6_9GAMM|nr:MULTISPECIES: transcriptional regulator [Microbulbifer]UFN58201.1 transcriptional regulator [Microbulbifer celer]